MVETETRAATAERREAAYYAERRYEEITDIGERIGYAIDVEIPYELRGDHLYGLTAATEPEPFVDMTARSARAGEYLFTGDQSFEATRRKLEHEEALMVDAFARGEYDADVCIKFSRIPDAVAEGKTDIDGYRRDLMRSFVRVYRREGASVTCRLISIDQNNQAGIEAVGQLIDIQTAHRSSEDILGDHTLVDTAGNAEAFCDELIDRIKLTYDDHINRQTGSRTYSGSVLDNAISANQLVKSRAQLVDEHMRTLDFIRRLGLTDKEQASYIEKERKQIAAAVVLSLRGVDVSSSGDASVMAEVDSGEYGRDCATATNGMSQPSLEGDWVKVVQSCPVCGAQQKITAVKTGEIISGVECGCKLNVCTGEKYVGGISKHPASTPQVASSLETKQLSKEEYVARRFGAHLVLSEKTVLGGTVTQLHDRQTHELVQEVDITRNDLMLAA